MGAAQILLSGHTHIPAWGGWGPLCANPGSVSLPRGGSQNSCLLYENRSFRWLTIQGEEFHREAPLIPLGRLLFPAMPARKTARKRGFLLSFPPQLPPAEGHREGEAFFDPLVKEDGGHVPLPADDPAPAEGPVGHPGAGEIGGRSGAGFRGARPGLGWG